jgi:hypothetical protein
MEFLNQSCAGTRSKSFFNTIGQKPPPPFAAEMKTGVNRTDIVSPAATWC